MPRATVRNAITQYLQSSSIPFLGTVFPHPPKVTVEGEFDIGKFPGKGSGAVIYVYLQEQSEERVREIGLLLGGKMRTYKVTLICFLRSIKAKAELADADNDTFLDGLVKAIQENRTPGTGAVFQWGEGDEVGGVDIVIRSELPSTIRLQITQIFTTVEVTVIEMNT